MSSPVLNGLPVLPSPMAVKPALLQSPPIPTDGTALISGVPVTSVTMPGTDVTTQAPVEPQPGFITEEPLPLHRRFHHAVPRWVKHVREHRRQKAETPEQVPGIVMNPPIETRGAHPQHFSVKNQSQSPVTSTTTAVKSAPPAKSDNSHMKFTQGSSLMLFGNFFQGFGLGVLITALLRYTRLHKEGHHDRFAPGQLIMGQAKDGYVYRLEYLNRSQTTQNFFHQNPNETKYNPEAKVVGVMKARKPGAWGWFSGKDKVAEIWSSVEHLHRPTELDVLYFLPGNKQIRYEAAQDTRGGKGAARITHIEPGREPVKKGYDVGWDYHGNVELIQTRAPHSPKANLTDVTRATLERNPISRGAFNLIERPIDGVKTGFRDAKDAIRERREKEVLLDLQNAKHIVDLENAGRGKNAWWARHVTHRTPASRIQTVRNHPSVLLETLAKEALAPKPKPPRPRIKLKDAIPFDVSEMLSLNKKYSWWYLVRYVPDPAIAVGWGIVGGIATGLLGSWVQANQVSVNLLQSFSDTENHHPTCKH
jgi:hypothetical protein